MSNESSKAGKENAEESKSVYLLVFNTSILVGLLAMRSVPLGDMFFPVFASVYFYIMSRVAFPPLEAKKPALGRWKFFGAEYLPKYVVLAAIIGLFMPLLQIMIAFVGGDRITVRESAPHLFLLTAQVVTENLTFKRESLALPIKALIPVLYNAWRLVSLRKWAVAVFSRGLGSSLTFASTGWGLFGRFVVVSNVLLWHFNLWCFLLPVYVPWTLRSHYTGVNTPRSTHVE